MRYERSRVRFVALVIVTAACGGSDKGTGPIPCDTYTGGVIGSATLPGTFRRTRGESVEEGAIPDVPSPPPHSAGGRECRHGEAWGPGSPPADRAM